MVFLIPSLLLLPPLDIQVDILFHVSAYWINIALDALLLKGTPSPGQLAARKVIMTDYPRHWFLYTH